MSLKIGVVILGLSLELFGCAHAPTQKVNRVCIVDAATGGLDCDTESIPVSKADGYVCLPPDDFSKVLLK